MAEIEDQLMLHTDSITWPQGHRQRGSGSFGAVYEVTVNGFPCIAKRLHDVLRQAEDSRQEGLSVSERFMRECKILSTLNHPNIVQFIGIHKAKGSKHDVSLVMEGLLTDLDAFLEQNTKVPEFLKFSFLLDTSNALVYLHLRSPPIVHRDVKAANVLLSRDMRAKLADLGTSKLLDIHPLSSTMHTKCPGTLGIMPPEALQEKPVYDTKLDVFSYGTLILHTVNQEFPMAYEVTNPKKGEVQIAKRQEAIDKLKKHCLYNLVKLCLQDNPVKRPHIEKTRDTVHKMSLQYPCHFTNFYDMYQQTETLRVMLKAECQRASQVEKLAMKNRQLQLEAKQALEQKLLAEAKADVFKEDFETERRDRETAAGVHDEILCRLQKEIKELTSQLHLEKAAKIRLEDETRQMKWKERERTHREKFPTKIIGTKSATVPKLSVPVRGLQDDDGHSDLDLLQSLRFDAAEHSSQGYRCSSRYEWYQTSSDVVVDIMIPNVKKEDITVKFTEGKVKVFIDSGSPPYNLSLHVSHNILPDKCTMKLMKSKVELKMKKAEGIQWVTLDKRGTPTATTDAYFQKWDSITEEDNA